MKHTTGPWNSTRPIPENNEFLRFVRSPTFEHIAYICALGEDTSEARANAHLIAAAPDLLEVLDRCLFYLSHLNGCEWIKGDGPGERDMRQRAKALQQLAFNVSQKAKGKSK